MLRLLAAAVLLAGCTAHPVAPPSQQPATLVLAAHNDGVNPEWFSVSIADNGTTALTEQRLVDPGQQTSWTLPMAVHHVLHYDIQAANAPAQEPGWGWKEDLPTARCPGGVLTVDVTVGYLANGQLGSHIGVKDACSLD
jgi:hypothetical protein